MSEKNNKNTKNDYLSSSDLLAHHPCLRELVGHVPASVLIVVDDVRVEWSPKTLDAFSQYAALILEWNDRAGLISPHDMPHLAERHILDALSLLPYLPMQNDGKTTLMDIGSGAGFPALPLKIVRNDLDITLIERNARKVSFLEWTIKALSLQDIRVLAGEFPSRRSETTPRFITARAVEKPERLLKSLKNVLAPETVFICQFQNPKKMLGPMFHVEHVEDVWSRRGWRRGHLSIVTRRH